MKNQLVVKDNALIDASFNLSLVEQRIMLMAVVGAREIPDLNESTDIEIRVTDYIKQYKIEEATSYRAMLAASKTLKRREFSYINRYKGDEAFTLAGWVNRITYVPKKGLLVLNLSKEVISLISRLESQFTQYHLEQVSDFNSKYSIRLYEIIVKWLSVGHTDKIEISDLRGKLGVSSTEYKTMSLFKVNVLDKAVAEINKESDIKINYEQFRVGRSIKYIQFFLAQKNLPIIDVTPESHENLSYKLTKKQISLFAPKLALDQSFGSRYGEVGEHEEQFKLRLLGLLEDESFCESIKDDLVRLGFVAKFKRVKK